MSLSNIGNIKINDVEYPVKAITVTIKGLKSKDSAYTDDGVYHYGYILNRVRQIKIVFPILTLEKAQEIVNAVSGKSYTLTYTDTIKGENTITVHTDSIQANLFSGVILNGCWNGLSIVADEVGGENV